MAREEWRKVFWISAGVMLAGATFFILFARGTVQKWNSPHNNSNNEKEANRT